MNKIWIIAFLFFWGAPMLHSQSDSKAFPVEFFVPDLKENLYVSSSLTLPALQAHVNMKHKNLNWGSTLKLAGKSSALILKAGNLTLSGSASSLTSPSLSPSFTAFTKVSATATSLETGYESSSSFSKPQSFFLQYVYTAPNKNQLLVNGFYSPQENKSCLSLELKWYQTKTTVTKNKTETQKNLWDLSFTAGLFPYNESKNDSWFLTEPYFTKGIQPCFNMQESYSWKNGKTLFSQSLFFTPKGQPAFTFENENLFETGNWSFSLSQYINCFSNVYSANHYKLKETAEIKLNLQHQQKKENSLLKEGLTFFTQFDLYNLQHYFYINPGFEYSSGFYSFALSGNTKITYVPSHGLKPLSYKLKMANDFSFSWCKLSLEADTEFIPPVNSKSILQAQKQWNSNESFSISFSTKGKVSFNTKLNLNLIQKDWNNYGTQINYSAGLSYNSKFFDLSATLKEK